MDYFYFLKYEERQRNHVCDNFFCQVTSVKAAIVVSEWTRNEMSGMKLNADGV